MLRFFIFTFALAGCAAQGTAHGDTTVLQRRIDEALRRQLQAEQKLEALEDRVFLLTDQVESQKVAASRTPPPRLPVIALAPTATSEDAPSAAASFEGEARSTTPDRVRATPYFTNNSRELTEPISSRRAPAAARPAPRADDDLGVAKVPPISASPSPSPGEDPMKLYRAAYEQLRAGHHEEAAHQFRDFVRRWPHHDLADNAAYWLGECFYAQKQFTAAAGEFRAVVARWPLGNKAPDALVKLAFCLLASGDPLAARDVLGQVGQSYPRTEAARLAELKLADLPPSPREARE